MVRFLVVDELNGDYKQSMVRGIFKRLCDANEAAKKRAGSTYVKNAEYRNVVVIKFDGDKAELDYLSMGCFDQCDYWLSLNKFSKRYYDAIWNSGV